MEGEESNSTKEDEQKEEEPRDPSFQRSIHERKQLKRYIPPDFRSRFVISIIDDDLRIVREEVDSKHSKIWKKSMVENGRLG